MASAFYLLSLLFFVSAYSVAKEDEDDSGEVVLTEDIFGYIKGTEPVKRYTWTNKNGVTVQVITYGGRVTSIKLPDKHGNIKDIVLGFDKLEDYLKDNPAFGAILGRVDNRIIGANLTINGVNYKLTPNEFRSTKNTVNGGTKGFDVVLWEPYVKGTELILRYVSEDGENGFPGKVEAEVSYELTPDNLFIFKPSAKTTKPTPINIANRGYYNLAGQDAGPKGIYEHVVTINADKRTMITTEEAPTGEIVSVEGTDFDFRSPRQIGEMMKKCGGYDNNFCINVQKKGEVTFVGSMEHPNSGIKVDLYSNQPGMQLYTGGHMNPKGASNGLFGKKGVEYFLNCAMFMETQDYPDAVHHPNFPSTILNPGKRYSRTTIYKFSTKK